MVEPRCSISIGGFSGSFSVEIGSLNTDCNIESLFGGIRDVITISCEGNKN